MTRIAHTFVGLFAVTLTLGTPAMSAGSSGSEEVSARSRVAITVTGRGVAGDAGGTFTLIGAASDSGTSTIIGNVSRAHRVLGQGFEGRSRGPGELKGKAGNLSFTWSGSFVPLNASTYVTTGIWRIRRGTGIYRTWKGGGSFVSVDRRPSSIDDRSPPGVGSFEARFEGLVTR